jgi:DNA-binding MarR family transcriptional regulator
MANLKEAITYLSDLIEKIMSETIKQSDLSDLTQQQLHYLLVIFKMQNPTITKLARELRLSKPTVTVLINKLVKKDYLSRVQSDEDRRCMYLHVSRKGAKIKSLREIAYRRMEESIKSGLSETETTILAELLKKIIKHG